MSFRNRKSHPIIAALFCCAMLAIGGYTAYAYTPNNIVTSVPNSGFIQENSDLKITPALLMTNPGGVLIADGGIVTTYLTVTKGFIFDGGSATVTNQYVQGTLAVDGGIDSANGAVLYGGVTSDGIGIDGGLGALSVTTQSLTVGPAPAVAIAKITEFGPNWISPTSLDGGSCGPTTIYEDGGCSVGDGCFTSIQADGGALGNFSLTCECEAKDFLTLHFCNVTTTNSAPPPGFYGGFAVHP